jgi:F420-non-reducing hydrogenase small subunit
MSGKRMNDKPKFAMYWAAACGGCEISLLNIHEKILALAQEFDIVFWPCLMDGKKQDLERLPDGSIALTLFNGAIRTDENAQMAHLLRAKSQTLIAYGSCACEGCIPGLSNLSTAQDHFRTMYLDNSSTANPDGVVPACRTKVPEGDLILPAFHDLVLSLGQTVGVDSFVPGCPPEGDQVGVIVDTILSRGTPVKLPRVMGAGDKALCEECPLTRTGTRITRIQRPQEMVPEPNICLLEQGLLCVGPATRSGCGAKCPRHNMACLGCYGPLPGVADSGGNMLAAVASIMDIPGSEAGYAHLEADIQQQFRNIVDPAGQFYRFSLAVSLLGGGIHEQKHTGTSADDEADNH